MTLPTITLDHVRAALALPDFDVLAAWERMAPRPHLRRTTPPAGETPRQAAVLVLVYPVDGALTTLLIRRTPDPGVHSGQVGFPGGAIEPGDADPMATARREAGEEIGLWGPVTTLGQLTPLYIPPSRFLVTPTVGGLPARPAFHPNPAEVAELLELPLAGLLDDGRRREEDRELAGATVRVPFYDVAGHQVWGATALMLSEVEMRLRAVLGALPGGLTRA